MLFLRHGHAAPDEFNIDLLRELSDKGRMQAEEVIFPTKYSDIFVSPAVRALQTAELATGKKTFDVLPSLYAAILLPEMESMYKEHGENVRSYINDTRITNTVELTKKAAKLLRQIAGPNSLIVAHGLIVNLIAHHIYGIDKVLDINLGTAKGFWVKNENEIIEF